MDRVKYWIFDVDGTMTDGSVYYDENGNEMKCFNTRDAAGFFAAHAVGMKILVITGRECQATKRRMEELHVDWLFQKVKDKEQCIHEFMTEHNVVKEELGYVGDDLNDLCGMKLAGYIACPADAAGEIRDLADYISEKCGGYGVIRDVIQHYLSEKGLWEQAIAEVYGYSDYVFYSIFCYYRIGRSIFYFNYRVH